MTNKELLRALIAEIDLIMHDKDYRFPESENTWYSRESCKVLTPEEVFEELRTELLELNHETNSRIAELQKQLEQSEKMNKSLYREKESAEKILRMSSNEQTKEILELQKQLEEKEKELREIRVENYTIKSYRDFLDNKCKNLIKENKKLKQQLQSQPAEIVEKIKEQLYSKAISPTGTGVNCVRLYDIRQILDAILKGYQK